MGELERQLGFTVGRERGGEVSKESSDWASADGSQKASDERKEVATTRASDKPLQTATATVEPTRVKTETEEPTQRNLSGSAGKGVSARETAFPGSGRPLGKGRRSGEEDPKLRGGWRSCMRCGRATTRLCINCCDPICQDCREDHDEVDCEIAHVRLCVVCGGDVKTNVCGLCGVWFCSRHRDHDCPTPKTEDQITRRDADLGRVREELERGIPGDSTVERIRHKPVV